MAQAATAKRPASTDDARSLQLTSAISSVPIARHTVADDLRESGIPTVVVDNVLVVVTELVSNAVLHARAVRFGDSDEGVLLRWTVTDRHVLIDVTDGGGNDRPQLREAPSAEPEGRGLAIVDALARDWSVRQENGRVTVQAVVGPWSGEGSSER